MSMQDKNYKKYEKQEGLIETDSIEWRKFPKVEGIEDFTHISRGAVYLDGYSEKWAGRVHKSQLEDLIAEVLYNPGCSYETCYTKDAFDGYVPAMFSSIIKKPETVTEVDYDVFGSRVMNCLGVPTAYNLRIDAGDEFENGRSFDERAYLISVDFIRENEEFFDLYDVYSGEKFDIDKVFVNGLERTIRVNTNLLKIFLNNNAISFTETQLKDFGQTLAKSIVARSILLGDKDFRNANSGILINRKEKSFRPAPNHDYNYILQFEEIEKDGLKILEEYSRLYPKDCEKLIDKFLAFVACNKYGASQLKWLANNVIEDDYDRKRAVSILTNNARRIVDFEVNKISELGR